MKTTSAHKGFNLFISVKKGRIGLPKSKAIIQSILNLALSTPECLEFFTQFSKALQLDEAALTKQANRPDIVAYLRGGKCVVFEALKSLRKLFFFMDGPQGVETFDKISTQKPLLGTIQDSPLLESVFAEMEEVLASHLTETAESQFLLPLLQQFLLGGDATATVNFVAELSLDDLSLAQISTMEAPPEKQAPLEDLEDAELKALKRFHRTQKNATDWTMHLVARGISADATRKGTSIRTLAREAELLYRRLAEQGCIADMALFLDSSRKAASAPKCSADEKRHKRLQKEVEAFFKGAYDSAQIIHSGFAKVLENTLHCPRQKSLAALEAGAGDFTGLGPLLREHATERLAEEIKKSTAIFLRDMRNEGIVSEASNALNVDIATDGKVACRINAPLRRGQQGLRGIRPIIKDHSDILGIIARSPSVCEPLFFLLKEGRVAKDCRQAVARAAADLVNLDFSLKNALVKSAPLRDFLATYYARANFKRVMSGFAGASLQIKNAVLKNPQLLKVVLLADGSKPELGMAQTIFANPSDLKSLADSLGDRDRMHAFLKKYLHMLSQKLTV